MAAGIRAMFGTDTKTMHMGRGAQNGLLAAQMASHGFESCPRSIECWARLVSTTVNEESLSALTRGGGDDCGTFQILENTFKPYPCGIVIHPLIDAALQAHETLLHHQQQKDGSKRDPLTSSAPGKEKFIVEGIKTINATVNPQCVRLCSVQHPTTGLETIFSLYHSIAVALLYGQAGPAQFSDQGCKDEATMRLRDRIHVRTDESVVDDSATLKITFMNDSGQEQEQTFHIEHATGSLAKPMTSEQLEAKFTNLSNGVLGDVTAREVIDKCWDLDRVLDMRELMPLLVPL